MYDYFNGKLTKISPTSIVVETHSIGYLINVANPYAWSSLMNTTVKISVHQVIREDAHTLFGFVSEAEKALFLRLISVSGIGPKSALAIIAASDNEGLIQAIDHSDITYLTKFPGVGKKTAMQMILDLEGKFEKIGADAPSLGDTRHNNIALDEAIEALVALGYKATELTKIKKTLETKTDLTSEAYIKQALKLMMK